jgi:hypothetical protein
MRRVIIESPYAGDIEKNLIYARAAMRDCLERGEAPFASHLLYTQPGILDDNDPDERKLGIQAGLIWGQDAEATVVYYDLGISDGMKFGIEEALKMNRSIEFRKIPGWLTLRNDFTPEGKAIWDAVDQAASRCPEWIRKMVEKAELSKEGTD